MTYIPKGEAAKEIHEVYGDLNTAQHQWNTYATILGSGYTAAYQNHENVLNRMKEHKRASSEAMYFMLSLLTAGFAGGLVGGLMAPWVKAAGEGTAKAVFREVARETTKEFNKKTWATGAYVAAGLLDKNPYSPAVTSPLLYWQDMLSEIGIFFAAIREQIEREEREADADFSNSGAPHNYGKWRREVWSGVPIISEYPRQKDMPDKKKVEREAEIAMWIAWAGVRDVDYWSSRTIGLEDGETNSNWEQQAFERHYDLQPVVERLYDLDVAQLVTRKVYDKYSGIRPPKNRIMRNIANVASDVVGRRRIYRTGWLREQDILIIPKLQMLGQRLGGTFFSKVADVVKSSESARKELSKLLPIPPIYKR